MREIRAVRVYKAAVPRAEVYGHAAVLGGRIPMSYTHVVVLAITPCTQAAALTGCDWACIMTSGFVFLATSGFLVHFSL